MIPDRADYIRTALGTLGRDGVHVSLVPSRTESHGLVTTPGLLGHKIALVVARVFAAWSATQKLPILGKGDAAALDSAMGDAVEISRLLPLHSGDTLALMSARTLHDAELDIAHKLPAILSMARDFVDRDLGGPLVQAHLRDLVIHAGAAARAMGDLEGGVASDAFVTQAHLRDDLGRSPSRQACSVAVFALRTDCELYASLGRFASASGPSPRVRDDVHEVSYATAHELVLTAKLVGLHAGATPFASAILDTAAMVAPKLATAHLALAPPTFNLVALHGLVRSSGITAFERFAEDAPRIAEEIERGQVARIATTYASLRPCFASRGAAPRGSDVQMDVNGVYLNLEPTPVKVAIVAVREDCEAYSHLSGRSAVPNTV